MDAINRAIKAAGGKNKLANLIGVSPQFVGQMASGKRRVPPALCWKIEAQVGVKCKELRPDVFVTEVA